VAEANNNDSINQHRDPGRSAFASGTIWNGLADVQPGSGRHTLFSADPDRRVGHRTVLGLTFKPGTSELWETENGPQGGDEVNVIKAGKNYGWPLVTYGRDYDGKRLPGPVGDGFEPPELFRVPSVTASGILFYNSDKIPAWKGNLFLGSMTIGRLPATGNLQRIVFNQNGEQHRESLLTDLHQRIRDVRQGPDGLLYLLTDENDGALLKIEPAP
jgi:glucose/arabinose dehydrogenase